MAIAIRYNSSALSFVDEFNDSSFNLEVLIPIRLDISALFINTYSKKFQVKSRAYRFSYCK